MDSALPPPPGNCTSDQLFNVDQSYVGAVAVLPNLMVPPNGTDARTLLARCCPAGNVTVHNDGCSFECHFGTPAAAKAFDDCNLSHGGATAVDYSRFEGGATALTPVPLLLWAVLGFWTLSRAGIIH